jgi:hypothetical protein
MAENDVSFTATGTAGRDAAPSLIGRGTARRAYLSAAASAAQLLRNPAVATLWDAASALKYYTVSGLAGHLAGQIFFIQRAMDQPVPDARAISILDYYRQVTWMNADHEDEEHVRIRRGSQDAAAIGHTALVSRVDATIAALPHILTAEPADRLVHLPGWDWTLTLDDFILTRMLELAVHNDDLAISVGVATPTLPPDVIDPVIDLLSRLAVRRHGPTAVLRALTRGERAPTAIAAL